MKNTFVKVLSFVMALMMVVGTFGTLAVFAEECDHTKGTLVEKKDPTCADYGYSTYICGKCGEEWEPVDEVKLPSAEYHNYEDVDAIPADCVTDAVSAGKKCTNAGCTDPVLEGCVVSEGTRLEHSFAGEVKPATCLDPETLVFTCKLCKKTAEEIKKLTDEEKAGGFMDDQLAEYEAGKWNADPAYGDPAKNPEHKTLVWSVKTAPVSANGVCTPGEAIGVCDICKEVVKTTVIPVKHEYTINLNPNGATCAEYISGYACQCGDVQEGAEKNAAEKIGVHANGEFDTTHKLIGGAWDATFNPKNLPVKPYTKDDNGDPVKFTIAELEAFGYKANDKFHSEASCEKAGYALIQCACGQISVETYETEDHTMGNWGANVGQDGKFVEGEYKWATNCTEATTQVRYCTECEAEEPRTIIEAAATQHNWKVDEDNSPEATCEGIGYTHKVCQNSYRTAAGVVECKSFEDVDFKDPIGHAYGDPIYVSGFCGNATYKKVCANNNAHVVSGTQYEPDSITACDWDAEKTVAATCAEASYKYIPCKVCTAWKDYTTGNAVAAETESAKKHEGETNAANHVYPTVAEMEAFVRAGTAHTSIVGYVAGSESTCTTAGQLIVKCTTAGCANKDTAITVTAPLDEHDYSGKYTYVDTNDGNKVKASKTNLDSTCTAVGYKDGEICTVCLDVKTAPTTVAINPDAHKFVDADATKDGVQPVSTFDATCLTSAYSVYNTECGHGMVRVYTGDPVPHNYHLESCATSTCTGCNVVEYEAPTCTEAGHHAYIACRYEGCGIKKENSVQSDAVCDCEVTGADHLIIENNDNHVIPSLGHKWKLDETGDWKYVAETCDDIGYNAAYICENGCDIVKYNGVEYNADADDDDNEITELNAARAILAHHRANEITKEASNATCSAWGVIAGTYCSKCDAEIECTKNGCRLEGKHDAWIDCLTAKPAHSYANTRANANTVMSGDVMTGIKLQDCTKDGFYVRACKDCGDILRYFYVEAANEEHNYGDWVETEVAGPECTTNKKVKNRTCQDCGTRDEEIVLVAATGHYTNKGVVGGEEFLFDYNCNKIADFINDTCAACGVAYKTLIDVDANNDGIKDIVKHVKVDLSKPETCTENGFTIINCKNCNYSDDDTTYDLPRVNETVDEIDDNIGHIVGTELEYIAPTTTTAGSQTYICANCDQKITVELDPVAYLDTTVVTNASSVSAGAEIEVTVKVSASALKFNQLYIKLDLGNAFKVVEDDAHPVTLLAELEGNIIIDVTNDLIVLYTENDMEGNPVFTTLEGDDVALVSFTVVAKEIISAGKYNIDTTALGAVVGFEEDGSEKTLVVVDNGEAAEIVAVSVGNLNGDATIGRTDVQMLITQVLSGEYNAVADVNRDGAVNVVDVAALRAFVKANQTTTAYLKMIGEDLDATVASAATPDMNGDKIRTGDDEILFVAAMKAAAEKYTYDEYLDTCIELGVDSLVGYVTEVAKMIANGSIRVVDGKTLVLPNGTQIDF